MKRYAFMMLLAGFGATAVVSSLAVAGDSKPCTIATKGDSETAQACQKGGVKAANKAMKKMVADAKAKGHKYTCEGCHKDLDNYELTKNAEEDFKKLVAQIKK